MGKVERKTNCEPSSARLLGDRYEVLDELGQGGMGIVYMARQSGLNKLVAVKVLNGAMLRDGAVRARFELEAKAGAKLSHPNLVSVYDYGFTEEEEPFLVMEYIEGISLDKYLSNHGTVKLDELLHIVAQVGKALHYLHENKIVHRDVKTSNILLQDIGGEHHARLLDLGIAKIFSESGDSGKQLTATGHVFGSPPYMSPEQCQGGQIDGRSDIYALGCVVYECTTGNVPLQAENSMQLMLKHLTDTPAVLPYATRKEQELSLLVKKCLEKDPNSRYQSIKELLDAFKSIGTASNAPVVRVSHRRWSRSKWFVNGGIFVGACVVFLSVIGSFQTSKEQSRKVIVDNGGASEVAVATSKAVPNNTAAEKVAQVEALKKRSRNDKLIAVASVKNATAKISAKKAASDTDARTNSDAAARVRAAEENAIAEIAAQKKAYLEAYKAKIAELNQGTKLSPPAQDSRKTDPKKLSERYAMKLASVISQDGLMSMQMEPAIQETFFATPRVEPAELAMALGSKLQQMGHSEISVTLPPGENRVLIRENTTGNARSVQLGKKERTTHGATTPMTPLPSSGADRQCGQRAAKLASIIAEYGLMSTQVEPAIQEAFFSNPSLPPAELAAALQARLLELGHSEIAVTLPAGENRVLIRENTGNARSVEFAKQ